MFRAFASPAAFAALLSACASGCALAPSPSPAPGDACDPSIAAAIYAAPAVFLSEVIRKDCAHLFECSPSASRALRNIDARVPLRFLDRTRPLATAAGETIDAVYDDRSGAVLLSDRPRTVGEVCSDLFHELIHHRQARFGARHRVADKASRLLLEYRAFYFQQLFEAELLLDRGALGRDLRHARDLSVRDVRDRLLNREEILRRISEAYGMPLDLGVRDHLPAYPWEG